MKKIIIMPDSFKNTMDSKTVCEVIKKSLLEENKDLEIKTYELTEIVDRDEKDIKIEYLQAQIEDLKKGMKKYESYSNVDEFITKPTESKESSNVETISKSTKKSK